MHTPQPSPAATPPARERILLAAHDLFYREGIRATGIDRVIAESSVTKVTFYRHFPSKNHLIREFLDYRHQRWMAWFQESLQRHGGQIDALIPTLEAWLRSDDFRGCAFINSVGELGGSLTEVNELSRRHKQDMTQAIAGLLPPSTQQQQDAEALALAVDGAIIRAQFDHAAENALRVLDRLIKAVLATSPPN